MAGLNWTERLKKKYPKTFVLSQKYPNAFTTPDVPVDDDDDDGIDASTENMAIILGTKRPSDSTGDREDEAEYQACSVHLCTDQVPSDTASGGYRHVTSSDHIGLNSPDGEFRVQCSVPGGLERLDSLTLDTQH